MTLRSLYICYLSLDDPLVHTQVLAYLEGLAERGHQIHLLTYERRRRSWNEKRREHAALARRGIHWHSLRYHKRPSLPATIIDALAGALFGSWIVQRHRLQVVHARSHVPAAAALAICGLTRRELIFDVRGLMAEEYEDAGRWRRGSAAFRITKTIERAALRRARGTVVLTEQVRKLLFGEVDRPDVFVIPCCADLSLIDRGRTERDVVRDRLGLTDSTVMLYIGKLTGWYMHRQMVEFHAAAREVIEDLHFLVLTQSNPDLMIAEFERCGIPTSGYTVMTAPPDTVAEFLAASDFAISFIRATPSKVSSSPTKIGEYLGAGLPVVANPGIGDLDTLLTSAVGVSVPHFEAVVYADAAVRIRRLASEAATPSRCREIAERALSLETVGRPRYHALYRSVAIQSRRLTRF